MRGTGSDKGKAVSILSRLYRNDGIRCYTIGIGDGANDETLLGAVDLPVLVQRPGGEWLPLDLPGLVHAEGVGPIGWNVFITSLFSGQAEK